MSYDLLVKNGTVVTASDTFAADVAVSGGRIAALGRIDRDARLVVDARGKVVLPGAVDGGPAGAARRRRLLVEGTTSVAAAVLVDRGVEGEPVRRLEASSVAALKRVRRDQGRGLPVLAAISGRRLPRAERERERFWRELADGAPIACSCPDGALWDAVQKRRITENRYVELVCAAPAKLLGLHPRKGRLCPGSDADLVVLDPNAPRGRAGGVKGRVVEVFLRGVRAAELIS